MKIRLATLQDASAIAQVNVDTWRHAYKGIVSDKHLDGLDYEDRRRAIADFLGKMNEHTFVYVAEDVFGKIVGYAMAGAERTGRKDFKGEIYAIYIHPLHHRQGIGKKLVGAVAKKLRGQKIHSLLIWCLENNPYKEFYKNLGGHEVDLKPIDIGGDILDEVAYGWEDTQFLLGE